MGTLALKLRRRAAPPCSPAWWLRPALLVLHLMMLLCPPALLRAQLRRRGVIARAACQHAPQAPAAQHQGGGAAQVGVIERGRRVVGRAGDPDVALLELAQRARQIGDHEVRHRLGRAAGHQGDADGNDALRAELAAVFSQHEAEPLCNRLLAAGLPAGPVQKIDQALTNPHTIHRGDVIEKDWYKGVASPIRLERTKPNLRRTPPKFSQHAAEVLGEFGYSSDEINGLVDKGVVCGPQRKR